MIGHEETLCSLLLDRISKLPIRILGKTQMEGREANIALISANHTSAELSTRIGEKGIATKHGHFYAYRLLKKMGFDPDDGVLRLSFAHYNNLAETMKLAEALADISG